MGGKLRSHPKIKVTDIAASRKFACSGWPKWPNEIERDCEPRQQRLLMSTEPVHVYMFDIVLGCFVYGNGNDRILEVRHPDWRLNQRWALSELGFDIFCEELRTPLLV